MLAIGDRVQVRHTRFSSSSKKMRLLTACLSLLSIASLVCAVPLEKRDADFLSVRTKLSKDMSGKAGDPKDKYFRE